MNMRLFLPTHITFFLILVFYEGFSQCIPTISNNFGVSPVVCPQQNINFTNPDASSNVTYEWDFCGDDMNTTPSVNLLTNVFGASIPVHTKILYENNEYFIFVLSRSNHKLYRVDLGNNLHNAPLQIVDLGTINGGNFPEPLIFKKDALGNWFAFSCNVIGNNNFVKLSFGSSLKNQPSSSFWGVLTPVISHTRSFDIIYESGNYYLISSGTDGKFGIFLLGNTLNNPLNASNLVFQTNLSGMNTPLNLEAVEDCGEWNVFIASSDNKNYHLRFDNGLTNAPSIRIDNLPPSFNGSFAMKAIEENGSYYVFHLDLTGKAHIFNYGSSLSNTPNSIFFNTITSNPNFANIYGVSGFQGQSGYILTGINIYSNQLFKIQFKRDCGANVEYTNATNPTNIQYQRVGNHPVLLTVRDALGNVVQRYTHTITVNPTTTVGNFTASSVCVGNAVNFNNTSVGSDAQVSSWFWDFGDGNTSNLKNPSHLYASAGTYNVTLTVNNVNGCSNTITKSVVVSNGVNADFQEITTACVGQTIQFNNLSTYTNLPFDEANGFYWNFGDGTYSPFQNPSKIYNTPGDYVITLTVKDQAGCTDNVSKNILILENPAVSFNFPTRICVGTPVQFNSIASNATEYRWFFEGHGTSSLANPTVTFSRAGFYDVTLEVRNNNNCQNRFTVENIEVLDAPNIVFNVEKVPNNVLQLNFINFSTGAVSYEWDFGDGSTSGNANPSHTFPQSGEYLVTLKALSINGCESSFSQVIGVGTLKNDVGIENVQLQGNQLEIGLLNKGNTLLNNILLEIQIGDSVFREVYENTLRIGENVRFTMETPLPQEMLSKNTFLCVKAILKPSLSDVNVSDNTACLNLSERLSVFEPYPNPTTDQVTLSFTAPQEGNVIIQFTDMMGRNVGYDVWASKGYNEKVISLQNFSKGMYIVSFQYRESIFYKKIVLN
jgi:PKD repeat protein